MDADAEDSAAIAALLEDPPPPTEALIAAWGDYRAAIAGGTLVVRDMGTAIPPFEPPYDPRGDGRRAWDYDA